MVFFFFFLFFCLFFLKSHSPCRKKKIFENKTKKKKEKTWTTFCRKKTQILDHILSLQHIYICVCVLDDLSCIFYCILWYHIRWCNITWYYVMLYSVIDMYIYIVWLSASRVTCNQCGWGVYVGKCLALQERMGARNSWPHWAPATYIKWCCLRSTLQRSAWHNRSACCVDSRDLLLAPPPSVNGEIVL